MDGAIRVLTGGEDIHVTALTVDNKPFPMIIRRHTWIWVKEDKESNQPTMGV